MPMIFFEFSTNNKSSLRNSYNISKIIQIFPIHGINLLSYIDSLNVYPISNKVLFSYYMIYIIYL